MGDLDAFNSDEAERRYLLSKPTCFLVLGKQGCGKSTLAKKFARAWKCILVTPSDVMDEAINDLHSLAKDETVYLFVARQTVLEKWSFSIQQGMMLLKYFIVIS